MAVTREQFSKWPENVAFKHMIRELVRAQRYVPPKQPIGTGPPPEGAAVAADDAPPRPLSPASVVPVRIGDWTLDQSPDGDLIARHASGHEQTIATITQGGS